MPFSVGRALREGRERLGMSVNDVAVRIKFAPRQIEALEADDFEHLFEPAFLRGFVRSYARLLEMDPQPLLQALPGTGQTHFKSALPQMVNEPFPTSQEERRFNLTWLLAALVVAASIAIYGLLLEEDRQQAGQVAVTAEQEIELPELKALAVPEETVATQSAVLRTTPQSAAAKEIHPVSNAEKKKDEDKPVSSPMPGKPVEKLESKPEDRQELPRAAQSAVLPSQGVSATIAAVRLVFGDDSDVEVLDRHGKPMVKQHSQKGSELWLNGEPPFRITVGRANAVRIYYRGKEVSLTKQANGESASLTLE